MSKHTSGGQFVDGNDKDYVGYYHQTRGKFYSGKRFVARKSFQIFKKVIQKDYEYYDYALPYKDSMQKYKLDVNQFELISYPFDNTEDVWPIYILVYDNKIWQVTQKSYGEFEKHPLIKSYKITLKKPTTFSNVVYNNKELGKIHSERIIEYIKTARKL